MKLIHQDLTYKIRGVLFDVYNQLGPNLPERFYQPAIAIGLEANSILCQTEKQFEVTYRGIEVGRYFVDIWVENGKVLLELKVSPKLLPIHQAQTINYLNVTNADLAMLVNFGERSVVTQRLPNFVRDKQLKFEWEERPLPSDTLFPKLTAQVLKALHRVHFVLQPGFLHQVYRRATMVELREQGIGYTYIKTTPIFYQNHHLGDHETRLINIKDKILLATVAVRKLDQTMKNQLRAHLKHHGIPLGILANFNSPILRPSSSENNSQSSMKLIKGHASSQYLGVTTTGKEINGLLTRPILSANFKIRYSHIKISQFFENIQKHQQKPIAFTARHPIRYFPNPCSHP